MKEQGLQFVVLGAVFMLSPLALGIKDVEDALQKLSVQQLFKLSAVVNIGIMCLFLGLVSCSIP
jgi:hypothetical protein